MNKVLKKYRKWIMVGGGVLIMVAWLLPNGLSGLQDPRRRVIATMAGRKVKGIEWTEYSKRYEAIKLLTGTLTDAANAAAQMGMLRRHGLFLLLFGVLTPLASSLLGGLLGVLLGFSVGGTMLLATLAASASYIAVPAAMRMAVPEANPGLSLAASLGVTFPFNVLVGVPLYLQLAHWLHATGA